MGAQVDGRSFSALGPATALVESQLVPVYPASAFFPSATRTKQSVNPGLGAVATTLPTAIGPGGSAGRTNYSMTKGGGSANASSGTAPLDQATTAVTSHQSFMGVPMILVYLVVLTLLAYIVLAYIHFGGGVSAEVGR